MPARGTPATEILRRAGVPFEVREYDPPERFGLDREGRPSYGRDAAAALGVDPGRVFKTLVAAHEDTLVAALVPVDRELDLKLLAAVIGIRRIALADPAAAERATGYVVGGISPLGGRRTLRTVIDAAAIGQETVLVSAGRRGLQVALAPADLVRLTGASVAVISHDPGPDERPGRASPKVVADTSADR